MNRTQLTHIYRQEFTRYYKALTSVPTPTGNAKVIAKWPTKQNSTLNGIGRLHKGPIQSYRVW